MNLFLQSLSKFALPVYLLLHKPLTASLFSVKCFLTFGKGNVNFNSALLDNPEINQILINGIKYSYLFVGSSATWKTPTSEAMGRRSTFIHRSYRKFETSNDFIAEDGRWEVLWGLIFFPGTLSLSHTHTPIRASPIFERALPTNWYDYPIPK